MTLSTNAEASEALLEALSVRATKRGLTVRMRDDLCFDTVVRRKHVTVLGQETAAARVPDDAPVPDYDRAISLGPYTIILATLDGGSDDNIRAQLRSLLWWAALTRESLTPLERTDLHLILVSQENGDQGGWLRWKAIVDSNDRFCRKFLFVAPDVDETAIARFIDQTFLASPWDSVAELSPRAIDPLTFSTPLTQQDLLLSPKELASWLQHLSVRTDSNQELAEELLKELSEYD